MSNWSPSDAWPPASGSARPPRGCSSRSSTPRHRPPGTARVRSGRRRARPRRRACEAVDDDRSRPVGVEPEPAARQADDPLACRTRPAGGSTRRARRSAPPGRPARRGAAAAGSTARPAPPTPPRGRSGRTPRARGRRLRSGQLQLPDADAVETGCGVGGEVVLEARRQRRDLGDREARRLRRSRALRERLPAPERALERARSNRSVERRFRAAPARRASPSRRRGPGPARCSRRCARAGRPASGGPAAPGTGARGSSGRARASRAYGSPWCEVRVRGLEVGGREATCARAIADSRFGMCAREPRLDPVGVALAQLLRPGSVAGVELAGGVALHVPRAAPGAGSRASPCPPGARLGSIVERLAADDRRLGRQQAALGLVDGARDAVEARASRGRSPSAPSRSSPSQRGGSESAKWICISERP